MVFVFPVLVKYSTSIFGIMLLLQTGCMLDRLDMLNFIKKNLGGIPGETSGT